MASAPQNAERPASSDAPSNQGRSYRRSWPYLSAPLSVYMLVMVPICGLQLFLLLSKTPNWMRWSSGAVLVMTCIALARGYVRRMVLGDRGVRLRRLGGTIDIPWSRVRKIGVYVPGGGLGATQYAYVTTGDGPPAGKWDIGSETIQLQNRDGLLEAIQAARGQARCESEG